ncbi:sensor histidine kinase [Faunimonas sp. B44]|uniref:sensor histidine kinase n=1 Tax=Faunimonas sp. B44 TaxID=3461493 RepID=UPI004044BFC1
MSRSTIARPRSLTARLAAAALLWVIASVAAAGLLLTELFRAQIERRFDDQLRDHLVELVAASEVAPESGFVLSWIPSDPRFNRPHSGWYWQVEASGDAVAASQSLAGFRITAAAAPADGPRAAALAGPEGEDLRAVVEDISLPDAPGLFVYVVAGPVTDIQKDVDAFVRQLAATLALLAAGLVGAVAVQVRYGLHPLRRLGRELEAVRSGRAERLTEEAPAEVLPAVQEINALLDHNEAMLARARTQTGNLAHAIRNPLTVIRNEAASLSGEPAAVIAREAANIGEQVERHLARAHAAASAQVLGVRSSVGDVLADVAFSMRRLYEGRRLAIEADSAADLAFRGDRHDLEEMVGNLADNACKWARARVRIAARRSGGELVLTVEDDGPGIPAEKVAAVLVRGGRIDEAVPGAGLGLAIVGDIAELYRGRLDLGRSSLGGLQATLSLPLAL